MCIRCTGSHKQQQTHDGVQRLRQPLHQSSSSLQAGMEFMYQVATFFKPSQMPLLSSRSFRSEMVKRRFASGSLVVRRSSVQTLKAVPNTEIPWWPLPFELVYNSTALLYDQGPPGVQSLNKLQIYVWELSLESFNGMRLSCTKPVLQQTYHLIWAPMGGCDQDTCKAGICVYNGKTTARTKCLACEWDRDSNHRQD